MRAFETHPSLPFTLTGGECGEGALAEAVALLGVQCGGVQAVGAQVEQGVLGQPEGQAELLGVGALHSQEETVTRHLGPGSGPHHHSTGLGHVTEVDVAWGVRLWRDIRNTLVSDCATVCVYVFQCEYSPVCVS